MKHVLHLLVSFVLAGSLYTAASPALAQGTPNANEAALQGPAPEGGDSSGDPLYAYVALAFLASGAIFVVCKSARR